MKLQIPKVKQKTIPMLGGVIDALYTSLPVLSIINFLSIAVVLYNEIRPYLLEHAEWVKLWMFMAAIGGFTILIMVVVYKFILPSLWDFRGKQMLHEDSAIARELNEIKQLLEDMNESRNNSTN